MTPRPSNAAPLQLALPFPPKTSFAARLRPMDWNTRRMRPVIDAVRRLSIGDALVCNQWRVEYVVLRRGGYPQIRLYRGDHIVGLTLVNGNADSIKRELAALLPTRGADWTLEYDGAYWRRETRRKPTAIGDVLSAWRWN